MKPLAAPHSFATDRLVLRHANDADAEFIVELLNDPSWIRFIGDRGIRTADAARDYIANVLVDMYEREGLGLYVVELKSSGESIGLCGLLKRRTMPDVDIGFAFLERFRRRGYAYESARAWLNIGIDTLRLERIVAIADPANEASAALLEKLGLQFERATKLPGDETELRLFALQRPDSTADAMAEASQK